jgi:hypothetical protein
MNTQTVIQTATTKRRILNIQTYKSQAEITRAHPEVNEWKHIYQIPRGMSEAAAKGKLIQIMEQQGEWHTVLYQVGCFIMAPAVTTKALCICLERIGDNGPCPIHGEGL